MAAVPAVLETPSAARFHAEWDNPGTAARRLVLDSFHRVLLFPGPGPDSAAAVLEPSSGSGASWAGGCFGCSRRHANTNVACTLDPGLARRIRSGALPVPHGAHHLAWSAASRELVGGLSWLSRPRRADGQSTVRVYDRTRLVRARRR
jgi:hypothetical protein